MSDVAFAAGFSSIRQFNDTILAIYNMTPSDIRRNTHNSENRAIGARAQQNASGVNSESPTGAPPVSLTLQLPARAPFDGMGLMKFFADHAIPGVETGDNFSYSRRVRLPHGSAALTVSIDPDSGTSGLVAAPTVRVGAVIDSVSDVSTLVARVRRLLDLDADSAAIDAALSTDPVFAPLVERVPGIRIPGSFDAEEALFRTLIGQQISVAAARTVMARLSVELGSDGQFPTAREFATHGREALRGPAARINAIVGTAEAIVDGRLLIDVAAPAEEFTASLLAMPGIGQWTADYLALRVLGNPDVLLSSDLVVRASAAARGLPSTAASLSVHATRWAPWRSYAGLHLWRAR
jgi:AraC family transcriptional regulator of adaptative response / DNA-3-methyladenine glycosylase II